MTQYDLFKRKTVQILNISDIDVEYPLVLLNQSQQDCWYSPDWPASNFS